MSFPFPYILYTKHLLTIAIINQNSGNAKYEYVVSFSIFGTQHKYSHINWEGVLNMNNLILVFFFGNIIFSLYYYVCSRKYENYIKKMI